MLAFMAQLYKFNLPELLAYVDSAPKSLPIYYIVHYIYYLPFNLGGDKCRVLSNLI